MPEKTPREKLNKWVDVSKISFFVRASSCFTFFSLTSSPGPRFTNSLLIFHFPVASSKTFAEPHYHFCPIGPISTPVVPLTLSHALDGIKQGPSGSGVGQIAQSNQALRYQTEARKATILFEEDFHHEPSKSCLFERLAHVVTRYWHAQTCLRIAGSVC